MRKLRARKRELWAAACILLYLTVNVWILYKLFHIREYADIAALSCQAGSITETAFAQWRENGDGGMYSWAAVWKAEKKRRIISEDTGGGRSVSCYMIKGQPGAIFGRGLTEGRYFTEGEEEVCLLDQSTVRQIFGSDKVTGLTVQMDGKSFQIAGVLEGSAPVCVIPARKGTAFDGIAVRKNEAGCSSNQVFSMLETAFGGADGQKVDGQLYYVTAWLLYTGTAMMIPVLLVDAMLGYIRYGKRGSSRSPVIWTRLKNPVFRYGMYLTCLTMTVGILILGVRMADMGSDYLPTYWSDFEFFSKLFKDKAEQIRSLAAHQEFSVWEEMFGVWRRLAGAEIFAGMLAGVLHLSLKWGQNVHSTYESEEME